MFTDVSEEATQLADYLLLARLIRRTEDGGSRFLPKLGELLQD
jgi:hypothetical protein